MDLWCPVSHRGMQQQLSRCVVRGKSYLRNLRTDPTPGEQARWIPQLLWAMLAKVIVPLGMSSPPDEGGRTPKFPKVNGSKC